MIEKSGQKPVQKFGPKLSPELSMTLKSYIRQLLCLVMLVFSIPVSAESDQVILIDEAHDVLMDILNIPERTIPPSLLAGAQAIAIIPEVVKVGLVIGGRYGEGLIVMRNRNTRAWSDPVFITLTGGSVGFQIGAQSSDVILVFRNRRGINSLIEGKFTLGADAAVAAGPVGRHAAAATDTKLQSEILSYSRTRGLFAGVSLDGSALEIDRIANRSFYSEPDVTARDIFKGLVKSPKETRQLKNSLRQHAP